MKVLVPLFLLTILTACGASPEEIRKSIEFDPQDFKNHWYQGKAELNRYELKQARYGEIHEGHAVMIFVTEDFLREQQVKRDMGSEPADSVLKLNFTKNFFTGIYPYSLMTSVFTKVDFEKPETPKVSFSGQEWCGHVYMQLNRDDDEFDCQLHSYFQSEGDQSFELPLAVLEDEIWNMIRMAPNTLPLGKIKVIPSSEHARLKHIELEPLKAEASLAIEKDRTFSKEQVYVYRLKYTSGLNRELTIYFDQKVPYQIRGWRETGDSFGRELTTTAVLKNTIMNDYWSRNRNEDRKLRKELGLK